MEPNSPKKIQFAVPLFQSQIDSEAAEQFAILCWNSNSAINELWCIIQPADGKIQITEPVCRKQWEPKVQLRQKTAGSSGHRDAHLGKIDEKRMNNNSQDESQNVSPKQRKQSVYTAPAMKGTVQILRHCCLDYLSSLGCKNRQTEYQNGNSPELYLKYADWNKRTSMLYGGYIAEVQIPGERVVDANQSRTSSGTESDWISDSSSSVSNNLLPSHHWFRYSSGIPELKLARQETALGRRERTTILAIQIDILKRMFKMKERIK
ncbi:hypothetical protein L345_01029, partial [Ophiophagus hannah]